MPTFPIYAAGRDHPLKEPCVWILRMAAKEPQPFVTNSEVLRELMHRYLASGRWVLGREVLRAFAEISMTVSRPSMRKMF